MTIRLVLPLPVEPAITQKIFLGKILAWFPHPFGYFIFLREINDLHYINKIKNIYIHIMASSRYIPHGLNREIESQLKSGANGANNISGAGVGNGDVVGNGIISNAASKIPVVGPFIVPIVKRLGLGLADINTITKCDCVSCNGICLKSVGGGLFIDFCKGLNLGTQNVSGDGLFLWQKLQ